MASQSRISAEARTEETGRRVDGGSGIMRPQESLWLKDQCLLGAYMRGVIAFGTLNLCGWSYRLCTGVATTVISDALVGEGPTL